MNTPTHFFTIGWILTSWDYCGLGQGELENLNSLSLARVDREPLCELMGGLIREFVDLMSTNHSACFPIINLGIGEGKPTTSGRPKPRVSFGFVSSGINSSTG